jgi:hypothetical protein
MMGESSMETKKACIDIAVFRAYVDQGLIICHSHPTAALMIWNYTPKCQYERAWDEITMQARGLITTPEGKLLRGHSKNSSISINTKGTCRSNHLL